jgi:hypothetical protein
VCRFNDGIPDRSPADVKLWRQIRRERRRAEAARKTEATDYPFLVRCVEHPEWGAVTVEWAAAQVGASRVSALAEYANEGRNPFNGLRFHRDGYPFKSSVRVNCRPVVCLETGAEFPSIKIAAQWVGAAGASGVSESLRTGKSAKGFHFYYKGQPPPEPKVVRRYNAKPVVCVETGRRYGSIGEAAGDAGTSHANVHNALKYGHAAAGFHFRFAGRALVRLKGKPIPRGMRMGMAAERRRQDRRSREEQAA